MQKLNKFHRIVTSLEGEKLFMKSHQWEIAFCVFIWRAQCYWHFFEWQFNLSIIIMREMYITCHIACSHTLPAYVHVYALFKWQVDLMMMTEMIEKVPLIMSYDKIFGRHLMTFQHHALVYSGSWMIFYHNFFIKGEHDMRDIW